jgi:hypothetical protein
VDSVFFVVVVFCVVFCIAFFFLPLTWNTIFLFRRLVFCCFFFPILVRYLFFLCVCVMVVLVLLTNTEALLPLLPSPISCTHSYSHLFFPATFSDSFPTVLLHVNLRRVCVCVCAFFFAFHRTKAAKGAYLSCMSHPTPLKSPKRKEQERGRGDSGRCDEGMPPHTHPPTHTHTYAKSHQRSSSCFFVLLLSLRHSAVLRKQKKKTHKKFWLGSTGVFCLVSFILPPSFFSSFCFELWWL